ncbi:hypothetical protein KAS24_06080 [Candidatus Bathyarchaeota archaeon]|nr:hypothetical protein [Candidatus Bathyarchaeota archaeon]
MTKVFNICHLSFHSTESIEQNKKVYGLSLSGFQFKMHYKILNKLKKAGAVSEDSAVTIGEADLDYQEQMWLDYFAGVFLGKIKKTEDRRYYIR